MVKKLSLINLFFFRPSRCLSFNSITMLQKSLTLCCDMRECVKNKCIRTITTKTAKNLVNFFPFLYKVVYLVKVLFQIIQVGNSI